MHRFICDVCKEEFVRDWISKKRELPKYCSVICYGKAREKKHDYLIGEKRGKLTVISILPNRSKNGHVLVNCKCDCGKVKEILVQLVESGHCISCGCWKSGYDRMYPTFMKKVEKTDSCWIWKGMLTRYGYGKHTRRNSTSVAHRISYEYHVGNIPEGKILCHKCNNKKCVNPDHLYVGTAYENAQDAIRDGAYVRRSLAAKQRDKG